MEYSEEQLRYIESQSLTQKYDIKGYTTGSSETNKDIGV